MARGRKRFWAGWGLIGLGLASFVVLAWSSRYTLDLFWVLRKPGSDTGYGFTIARGNVMLGWVSPSGSPSVIEVRRDQDFELEWWHTAGPRRSNWGLFRTDSDDRRSHYRAVFVLTWPIGLALLATGVPLVVSGRRIRRRARLGLCAACGYDRRGLEADSACPECGKGTSPTLSITPPQSPRD